jgi:protein SCO1/2
VSTALPGRSSPGSGLDGFPRQRVDRHAFVDFAHVDATEREHTGDAISPAPQSAAWGKDAWFLCLLHVVAVTLSPTPGSSPGQALSRQGREGTSGRWCLQLPATLLALTAALGCMPALANKPPSPEPLPKIGPAPTFTLTNQDGKRFSLQDLRGKVAVVTFIFTTCSDSCPLLTAKLVGIHRKLAPDEPVFFVEITVDPLNDSPAVLKKYAEAFSAPPSRFAFLTGDFDEIHKVVSSYGVYYKQKEKGGIDHTFLTSIVDPSGTLRVQYIGSRFDPNEFLGDLRSLLEEASLK